MNTFLKNTRIFLLLAQFSLSAPLVLSGGLDMVLLKPFHPFIRILLGGVDFLDVVLIIPFIGIALSIYLKSGNPHLGNFITYILFIINSMILITAFHILILAL